MARPAWTGPIDEPNIHPMGNPETHRGLTPPPLTPALIYDETRIAARLALFRNIHSQSGVRLLYSIKAQPFSSLLATIAPTVQGFSVSSLFEARLAKDVLQTTGQTTGTLHLTSPGLQISEIAQLSQLCHAISFNSLEQAQRLRTSMLPPASAGLRINPQHSLVDDPRYDPCRTHSKLGVPLSELTHTLNTDPISLCWIKGLHFHTRFALGDARPLSTTLGLIEASLGNWLDRLDWLNLGGGYAPRDYLDAQNLAEVIHGFSRRYPQMQLWIEPGNAIVNEAGSLTASVIDRFTRDGLPIAVLDTSVHHLPELFEYQRNPTIAEHRADGLHPCMLVGQSCLAGDIFGEYRFNQPLTVGDRITLTQVGAYSLIKASRFNGHNLPHLYLKPAHGPLKHLKSDSYEDYRHQWSGP